MKKLSISKAWDEASSFLGREARLVAPIALALLALPAMLMGWANPNNAPANASLLASLAALVIWLAGLLTITALAMGWDGSIGQAITKAFKRTWPLLGAIAILFLPLAFLASVVIASSLVSAGITDPYSLSQEALMKLPSVFASVMILTLIILVLLAKVFPMPAVAMAESTGVMNLIRRSWSLTSRHFLRLFALLLLLILASGLLRIAVTFAIGPLATIVFGQARPFNLTALIISLVGNLVAAAVVCVSAALVARVYAQLAHQPSVPEVHQERN